MHKSKTWVVLGGTVKAIIFDWDDTILATFETVRRIFEHMAHLYGLPLFEKQRFAQLWGLKLEDFVGELWPRSDVNWLIREYQQLQRYWGFDEVPGATQVINNLHRKGYVLGIVSTSPKKLLLERGAQLGLDVRLFAFIQAAEDYKASKPDPTVFDGPLTHLSHLGIPRESCMYVGDALVDLYASRSAKICFIAVLSGLCSKADFLARGMEERNILPTIRELPRRIAELSRVGKS